MRERAIAHLPSSERAGNIKLMPGGIRDIEFITQALQLVHGRDRSEIRSRNTLESLERLYHNGLLSEEVRNSASRCYRIFRTVEHRLQILQNVRTHTLPTGENELNKVGARVSHSALKDLTAENFRAEVSRSIRHVRRLFDSFFRNRRAGEIPLLLSLTPGEKEVENILSQYGIKEGEKAHRFLSSLVYGDFPQLEGPETLKAAARCLPPILEKISATPDPSLTLKNLVRIVKATGAVRSTLELLAGGGDFLRLIVVLASLSTRLAGVISSRIELLDALVEGIHPGDPPELKGDDKNRLNALARWYEESLLHIHCQNPIPKSGPETLGPLFSESSEKAVKALFRMSGGHETRAALFALGSLGSRECRFGSDIDLVAVTPDDCDPREAAVVLRHLVEHGRKIGLGRIDLRLRGEGKGSPLVQTLERYRSYFEKRAAFWELLAFTKCRFVCGDIETGNAFDGILEKNISREHLPAGWKDGLLSAREKLESLSSGKWDVKHAPGGIYDIDFMLSAASFTVPSTPKRVHRVPPVGPQPKGPNGKRESRRPEGPRTTPMHLQPEGFHAKLKHLQSEGLLEKEEADILAKAHRLYYLTEHAAALHDLTYPPLPEREAFLEGYMNRLLGEMVPGRGSFTEKLESTRRAVRKMFPLYIDRLKQPPV